MRLSSFHGTLLTFFPLPLLPIMLFGCLPENYKINDIFSLSPRLHCTLPPPPLAFPMCQHRSGDNWEENLQSSKLRTKMWFCLVFGENKEGGSASAVKLTFFQTVKLETNQGDGGINCDRVQTSGAGVNVGGKSWNLEMMGSRFGFSGWVIFLKIFEEKLKDDNRNSPHGQTRGAIYNYLRSCCATRQSYRFKAKRNQRKFKTDRFYFRRQKQIDVNDSKIGLLTHVTWVRPEIAFNLKMAARPKSWSIRI